MPHSSTAAAQQQQQHMERGERLGCSALLRQLLTFVLWKLVENSLKKRSSSNGCSQKLCSALKKKEKMPLSLLLHRNISLKSTFLAGSVEYSSPRWELGERRVSQSDGSGKGTLSKPDLHATFGSFCPRSAQMSLSPCSEDERTGDRIMRWLVFADDEQALVSGRFNVRPDSALISSSNDHFTADRRSNCLFCSVWGSGPAERKPSLPYPSKNLQLPRLSHASQFEDAAYLRSPLCLNEAWQMRRSESHVAD